MVVSFPWPYRSSWSDAEDALVEGGRVASVLWWPGLGRSSSRCPRVRWFTRQRTTRSCRSEVVEVRDADQVVDGGGHLEPGPVAFSADVAELASDRRPLMCCATCGVNPKPRTSATNPFVSQPLSPATVRRRDVRGNRPSISAAVSRSANPVAAVSSACDTTAHQDRSSTRACRSNVSGHASRPRRLSGARL